MVYIFVHKGEVTMKSLVLYAHLRQILESLISLPDSLRLVPLEIVDTKNAIRLPSMHVGDSSVYHAVLCAQVSVDLERLSREERNLVLDMLRVYKEHPGTHKKRLKVVDREFQAYFLRPTDESSGRELEQLFDRLLATIEWYYVSKKSARIDKFIEEAGLIYLGELLECSEQNNALVKDGRALRVRNFAGGSISQMKEVLKEIDPRLHFGMRLDVIRLGWSKEGARNREKVASGP